MYLQPNSILPPVLFFGVISLVSAGCTSSLSAYQVPTGDKDAEEITEDGEGPGDPDDDDDDESDLVEIALDSITPDYGTADHLVQIEGGPFEEGATVLFDDTEAQVVDARPDRLIVEIPPGLDDGWIDVHVQTDEGASIDPLRFNSFESASSGFGALGILEWNEPVGDYWADDAGWGYGQVVFPIGPSPSWTELLYAPAPDSCAREYVGPEVFVYAPNINQIYLEASDAAGTRITLTTPGEDFIYENPDLPSSKLVQGADYSLDPMTGDPDWPTWASAETQGFVGTIPAPFSVTSPQLDQANFPETSASFNLAWSGPNNSDAILVLLIRQRWYDAQQAYVTEEVVSCWLNDDGNHAIPNLWSSWLPFDNASDDYDIVITRVGRANLGSSVMPYNDGSTGVLGTYWVQGALLAQ